MSRECHFWAPHGIRFNDCVFTEPTPLGKWTPPMCAGLFVILATDVQWSPKPFRPLYFGEFGNNDRPLQLVDGWLSPAERVDALFLASVPLPFSTTAQRYALRNELIQGYNPASQPEWARISTREIARKLDSIEVRQHEQSTQIIVLLQQ